MQKMAYCAHEGVCLKKERSIPRNDLPPLPPAAELETRKTLKLTVAANRELAHLRGYCTTLPSAHILVNSLVLQEAKSSSEIENIITTSDELYKANQHKQRVALPALPPCAADTHRWDRG